MYNENPGTVGERIKTIRAHMGLKQWQFADRLGVKRNTVSTWETDVQEPSNQAYIAICRESGASERWLRTGAGEMLAPKTKAEALGELVYKLTAKGLKSDFVIRIMEELAEMTEDELAVFEQVVRRLAGVGDRA